MGKEDGLGKVCIRHFVTCSSNEIVNQMADSVKEFTRRRPPPSLLFSSFYPFNSFLKRCLLDLMTTLITIVNPH